MDDLTRIKGIGKATARKLAEAGIDSFEKLARFAEFPELASTVEVEADWIAEAARILHENSEEKPPRSDNDPEAQSRDGAGLPADSGTGDPHTNNPPSKTDGGAGHNPAGPAGGELGPLCLQEVRWKKRTYGPGENLPADLPADELARLAEIRAIEGQG